MKGSVSWCLLHVDIGRKPQTNADTYDYYPHIHPPATNTQVALIMKKYNVNVIIMDPQIIHVLYFKKCT